MSEALAVAVVVLWVIVLALVVAVFALTDLAGRAVNIGAPALTSTLLFFLSPTCPVCKKLLPILKSTAASARLESLFTAKDVGVASIQDYVDQRP